LFRLRLTSVSGFPLRWLNIRMPCHPDFLPPLQTVLADFPHTACPRAFGESPSPFDLAILRNPRLGEALHAEAHICGSTMRHSMNHATPLTRIRSRQGPFAPPELPGLNATTTPSDSCSSPIAVIHSLDQSRQISANPPPLEQVSQVPDRSVDARCPQAPRRVRPLPLLVAWRSGIRLRPFREVGHSRLRFNEAESGSRFRITADVVAFLSFAPRVAPTHVKSASWRTSNSHDQFLSTDKICQAWPGAPKRSRRGSQKRTPLFRFGSLDACLAKQRTGSMRLVIGQNLSLTSDDQ